MTAREVIVFTLLFPSNFNSKMVSLLILVLSIKKCKMLFSGGRFLALNPATFKRLELRAIKCFLLSCSELAFQLQKTGRK